MANENSTPNPTQMTLAEYQKIERDIQLGLRDTTADGVSIKEIQDRNEALQETQFKERLDHLKDPSAGPDYSELTDPSKAKVLVGTTENGVSVVDAVESVQTDPMDSSSSQAKDDAGDQQTMADAIPEDFPGRKALVAYAEAGNASLLDTDILKEMTVEEFAAIPGVGDTTAQKMFDYPWSE